MAELKITFAGTCVSLFGIVPGVPMRTVLPDATAIRFGAVRIPRLGGHGDVYYYTMPHVAIARDRLIGGRHVSLNGHYLKVENAKPQALCRDAGGISLSDFDPKVEPSASVVFEGNAMAYFDVFGGRVWTEGTVGEEPVRTCVAIRTEGTPRISITPFTGSVIAEPEPPFETHELYVTNLDWAPAIEDAQFDFLLNYLVASRGIPTQLSQRTPGMPPEPKRLTLEHLGERLKALGMLIETEGTLKGWRESVRRGDEPGPEPPLGIVKDRLLSGGKLAAFAIDPVSFDPSCSAGNLP